MKIIVGAGGTGGHLYPALALVEYIKKQRPETEFLFVGTMDRLESKVVPELGYNYVGLNVRGLVGNPIKKGIAAAIFIRSILTARKIIKDFKPDIVIGFGGYPSASVVQAANMMKLKTLIHEQNSIIGLTNKILIKKVDKIVCCYNKAYDVLPREKTLLLGNPRASVVANIVPEDIYSKYQLDRNKKLVVIVMGSLGSKTINNVIMETLASFTKKDFSVLFVTGKLYYEEVINEIESYDNIRVVPYVEDMPSLLKSCDLIVSRAGASTIAEITAIGKPAILIPSPYVAANHQEYNAMELADLDAAIMIKEKELDASDFVDKVEAVLTNQITLDSMQINSKALGKPNACKDMYELIIKMLGEK